MSHKLSLVNAAYSSYSGVVTAIKSYFYYKIILISRVIADPRRPLDNFLHRKVAAIDSDTDSDTLQLVLFANQWLETMVEDGAVFRA